MILLSNGGTNIQRAGAPSDTILVGTVDGIALIGKTERVVYLKDQQMCVLTPDDWHILDRHQARVEADVQQIDWDLGDGDKGEFEHHMLKEIYEQPDALLNAMRTSGPVRRYFPTFCPRTPE